MNGGVVGLGETACKGGGGGVEAAEVTLETLRRKMSEFARERDWEQFHSPRNLLLALVGEVGELSEIFQWKGEVPKGLPGWGEREVEHLGEELADVLLYLIRLSDMCGVDLGKAALRKMELNARKYPIGLCRGSSKKHTHYTTTPDNGASGDDDNGNAGADADAGKEQC
uniref:dCTP pyrophosphatase 1 n=1 Tax=Oryza meridionalis TaxID=40149 RepID=A0A0E0CC66_9ORYZ